MKVIHFESIDSTNNELKRNIDIYSNNTIIYADYQTEGKGRLGNRVWSSNSKENLLCSILLKDINKDNIQLLSLAVGIGISKYLKSININNNIKWPNDIIVNKKKLCGILLEGIYTNTQNIIIGFGLNVNQEEFNGDYHKTPTSLKIETNNTYDIDSLLYELLPYLFKEIDNYLSNNIIDLKYLNNNLYNINNICLYNDVEYLIVGVNNQGLLQLKKDDSIIEIESNEIITN